MFRSLLILALVSYPFGRSHAQDYPAPTLSEFSSESPAEKEQRLNRVREARSWVPILMHRGATDHAPENTIAAFAASMERGADGFELDIRKSADGVLYTFHDDTLDRMTSGEGAVGGKTYPELSEYQVEGGGEDASRSVIPTLAAVFELARNTGALLHLDVKEPGLEPAIIELINEADLWEHVVEVNDYNSEGLRDHPKVKRLRYKGWFPQDGANPNWTAIHKFVEQEGDMVFCKGNPDWAVQALKHQPLNEIADGYRGIWYMNQPSNDEYVYKYSGGLGTYCAKHQPFAIYRPEVNKTFFCYGGALEDNSRRLLHMVSFFDHETKELPRPALLLDKKTSDAHDNPVISMDDAGHIWIFSTAHGKGRPSYIHRSSEPYDIRRFEPVRAARRINGSLAPITNFSYFQIWQRPEAGFAAFFTRYSEPAARTTFFMTSKDGRLWDQWQPLAAIEAGHYQISASGKAKAGSAFNFHPAGKGLNWRSNLYYIETKDGEEWTTAGGAELATPITNRVSQALVHDFHAEGLNVYLKDIAYDKDDRPIILFLTSLGYESGPGNDPRTWRTARWTGEEWNIRSITQSDNNYDMGSLYLEPDGVWRLIAPTESGPQPYNPGGEIAMWTSHDQGESWEKKQLTSNSERNHTYVRRPVNAHADFYGLWADGHGRQPSESALYYCDRDGTVYRMPRIMNGDSARAEIVPVN